MRLIFFLKKELLQLLQAPEALFMMVLFPIALTGVLGMALSNMTASTVDLPTMHVPLVSETDFTDIFKEQAEHLEIVFDEMSLEEAEETFSLGESEHVAYLKEGGLELWTSAEQSLEYKILEAYANAFVDQSNMVNYAMSRGKPEVLSAMGESFVETTAVDGKASPNSFGYYGVTMLTLIMMYGSMQAAEVLSQERSHHTIYRLQSSPYPMTHVFIIKIIATLITLTLQVSVVMLMNALIFKVNYGSIPRIMGLLASYGLFTCSLGVVVDQLVKKIETSNVVLTILTTILLFTGGAYFQVEGNAFFERLADLSPVGWINQALFRTIYQPGAESPLPIILRFTLLSLVMLVIAGVVFLKRGTRDVSDY